MTSIESKVIADVKSTMSKALSLPSISIPQPSKNPYMLIFDEFAYYAATRDINDIFYDQVVTRFPFRSSIFNTYRFSKDISDFNDSNMDFFFDKADVTKDNWYNIMMENEIEKSRIRIAKHVVKTIFDNCFTKALSSTNNDERLWLLMALKET